MMDRITLWQDQPSQAINVGVYLSCFFLVTIPLAFWRFLQVRATEYIITSERLITTSGVFSRKKEEIELYRIKDYEINQPFIYRLFGIANIRLIASDPATPEYVLKGIDNYDYVQNILRDQVETLRKSKHVIEVD